MGDAFFWNPPSYTRGTYKWVKVTDGTLPEGAVRCGMDQDDTVIYAGRASYAGDLLPAKITKTSSGNYVAYVPYDGKEYKLDQYEVMISKDVAWKSSSCGEIPGQAVIIGLTATGENLYFGRTFYKGTITPGKVHPSHKVLYFPYGDEEKSVDHYELMILV